MSTNISTAINTTDADIGGIPYILNYLSIYLPYSILSLIGVIVGLAGNILIISAVFVHHDLRKNPTCILISNLAISDLSISLFVNTSTVAGVYAGKKYFDQHMGLCIFFGAACMIACGTSLVTMGLLAFNRYICIFYHHNYSKYFSTRNTLISCVVAWILGVCVDLPNFISGAGAHVYDIKALSCLFDRLKIPYTISFSVGCIIIPCICIGLVYLKIFCHAFHTRSKVKEADGKKKTTSNYRNKMEALKIAKSLFASFFIFAACWIPVSIIFIVGKEDQLPIPAHTFTNLPAHLNSAINPIFYGLFNTKIREGYRNLFRLITCNRYFARRVTDSTLNSTKNNVPFSIQSQIKNHTI